MNCGVDSNFVTAPTMLSRVPETRSFRSESKNAFFGTSRSMTLGERLPSWGSCGGRIVTNRKTSVVISDLPVTRCAGGEAVDQEEAPPQRSVTEDPIGPLCRSIDASLTYKQPPPASLTH